MQYTATLGGLVQFATLCSVSYCFERQQLCRFLQILFTKVIRTTKASKMSVPAFRQLPNLTEPQNMLIVTKKGVKLVVSSDAYHGVLTAGKLFRCVFCEAETTRDVICKEIHKISENHRKTLEIYPHVEEFKENLIRKLHGAVHYCTICNVVIASHYIYKHITTEAHTKQLQMAKARAVAYKPFN